jgi:hypothetical protein
MTTPSLLPEIKLRAPTFVPPTVLLGADWIDTPSPLGKSCVPEASVPM